MSTRKRRAAFDPNGLNDLDELLPPLNLVRDAAAAGAHTTDVAPPANQTLQSSDKNSAVDEVVAPGYADSSADETKPSALREADKPQSDIEMSADTTQIEEPGASVTVPTESDNRQSSGRRADARRKIGKRDAPTTLNRVAPPEVALPEEIYSALRSLTLNERSLDPTTARSYGQVVLDAVEQHADELEGHWANNATTPGTGLFKRAEVGRPTRRRHNAPRARVPLAGVINTDAAVLDELANHWGAGSRSALVEQALRLYLRVN